MTSPYSTKKSGRDVVQSSTEIVEGVPDCQRHPWRQLLGRDAEKLRTGLRIRILPDFAEISGGILNDNGLSLLSMAVGPLDL